MTPKYKITDEVTKDGFHVLEMTESPFMGVQWTYGGVSFEEKDDDSVALKYDVDIVSEHVFNDEASKQFYSLTGDILVDLIEKQIESGEVQYHGGTAETETITEPDRDDLCAGVQATQ